MISQTEKKVTIMVFGQTGVGKSYILNLIAQSDDPKTGPFKNLRNLHSVTKECSLQAVDLDIEEKFQIKLNLIDTPGIFDTEDNHEKQLGEYPTSIENIQQILGFVKDVANSEINRILLVMQADSRQTVNVQAMFEIAKILIGQDLKIIGVINKCQKIYDEDDDSERKLLQVKQCRKEWKELFLECGVEDVICIGGQGYKQLENTRTRRTTDDQMKIFYQKQWLKLFTILKKSINVKLASWDELTCLQKQQIGKFFNYKFFNLENENEQVNEEEEEIMMMQQLAKYFEKQEKKQKQNQQIQYYHHREQHHYGGCDGCVSQNVDVLDNTGSAIQLRKLINSNIPLLGRNANNRNLGLLYSSPKLRKYLKIQFDSLSRKNYVECSNHHLIFCQNRKKFIRADQLTLDDSLLYFDGIKQVVVKVMDISTVIVKGCFSPLTTSGEFFGNGILFSCYVSFNPKIVNQAITHLALIPLILYRRLTIAQEQQNGSEQGFQLNEYESNYIKFLKWFCK